VTRFARTPRSLGPSAPDWPRVRSLNRRCVNTLSVSTCALQLCPRPWPRATRGRLRPSLLAGPRPAPSSRRSCGLHRRLLPPQPTRNARETSISPPQERGIDSLSADAHADHSTSRSRASDHGQAEAAQGSSPRRTRCGPPHGLHAEHSHSPAISRDSSAVSAARAVQKCRIVQQGEVPMSPFVAALVACGYMASVFVVFGLLRPGHHVNKPHHP
jgi:hypothetical protein